MFLFTVDEADHRDPVYTSEVTASPFEYISCILLILALSSVKRLTGAVEKKILVVILLMSVHAVV